MSSSSINWIHQPKIACDYDRGFMDYSVEHLLTKNHSGIDHVDGLKVNLFPYQKKSLKAMADLENIRVLPFNGGTHRLKLNAGVLSEPVGSGKTIITLALVLLQKIPRVLPDIVNYKLCEYRYIRSKKILSSSKSIVRKEYQNILTPTLVFVSISILDQWVEAVKKFTTLKLFV